MKAPHFGIEIFTRLIRKHLHEPKRILIAGCGQHASEVFALAQNRSWQVVGFDLSLHPDLENRAGENWSILKSDVMDLPFEEGSFDAVMYYHAIEHVSDPERSIREIARVLRAGGGMFLGTPNRARLIGYIDSKATLKERIRWNYVDWTYRLRGRFRNEYGAHAGFTEKDLYRLMSPYFRSAPRSQ